jgi:hypothetical protein
MGILSSPLFAWAWPHTSVIDIVAGAYIRIPIRLDQGQGKPNSHVPGITSGLTGFLSGMTRLIRFAVIDKT